MFGHAAFVRHWSSLLIRAMKNFKTLVAAFKSRIGHVTSSDLHNCGVRVNSIPIFENVLDSTGHLQSDIELSLRSSSDPEIQQLINSGFYSERDTESNENWNMPFGTRHMSMSQLLDHLRLQDEPEPQPEPQPAPEPVKE